MIADGLINKGEGDSFLPVLYTEGRKPTPVEEKRSLLLPDRNEKRRDSVAEICTKKDAQK